jgi:hypothetical protein
MAALTCEECGREFAKANGLAIHRAAHKRREQFPINVKRCPRCEQVKPIDQFPLSKGRGNRIDGRYPYCLSCKAGVMRDANRRYRETHPIDHQRYNLTRAAKRLGVSVEAVEARLAEQGGVCAICGGGPTGNHGRLVIDHNHTTGAVRGLLCGMCNQGIGSLKDSIPVLEAAVAYLRRYGHHEGE